MEVDADAVARELRKVANLLAMKLLEGLKRGDQARMLHSAGFTNAEIASLTGMTEGSARAATSRGRRRTALSEEEPSG